MYFKSSLEVFYAWRGCCSPFTSLLSVTPFPTFPFPSLKLGPSRRKNTLPYIMFLSPSLLISSLCLKQLTIQSNQHPLRVNTHLLLQVTSIPSHLTSQITSILDDLWASLCYFFTSHSLPQAGRRDKTQGHLTLICRVRQNISESTRLILGILY